jgi:hypothetical protein
LKTKALQKKNPSKSTSELFDKELVGPCFAWIMTIVVWFLGFWKNHWFQFLKFLYKQKIVGFNSFNI